MEDARAEDEDDGDNAGRLDVADKVPEADSFSFSMTRKSLGAAQAVGVAPSGGAAAAAHRRAARAGIAYPRGKSSLEAARHG